MTQIAHRPAPSRRDENPDRPAGRAYALAPVVAIRVAGLPVERLDAMRFTRTWRLVDEIGELSSWLEREGAALSGPLHDAIAAVGAGGPKPQLVGLRRAIYAGRRPDRRALSPAAIEALPAETAERVLDWTARLRRRDGLRASLPHVLAAERRDRLAALREAVAGDGFRRGLAQGSPVLSARLEAWLAGPADRPPDRQEMLRLARYVARAAAKTSPYATFAFSGFGRWAPGGPAFRPAPSLTSREVTELDRAVLRPVWAALTRHPGVSERATLRVNPTAADDGTRVWFLGAGHTEMLVSVHSNANVRAALAWVRGHPAPTLADAPGLRPLVDAGLLELLPPYDEQGPDPVGDLSAWLAALPLDVAPATAVHALARALTPPETTEDVPRDRPAARTVRRALTEILAPASSDRPSLPDKNLLWGSGVLPGPVGSCALPAWRAACDDLDVVRRAIGLFDPDLPVKVAAAAFFLERHGPEAAVPVLDLYRAVHTATDGPGGVLRRLLRDPLASAPASAGDVLPRLRTLAELRRGFWGMVAGGPEVVDVGAERLAAFAAALPGFVRAPGSICCYVQTVPAHDDVRVVVNTISAGYGRGLSRLRRLVELAGGEAPPAAELHAGQGDVLVAECRGVLGGGLNVRAATADRAIDYPFTPVRTGLPALSAADLRATHDGDRLVLRDGDGHPIKPVHLGMTAQYWLPPWLQFLVRTFGEPATAMPPGWVLRGGAETPPEGRVDRRPRLNVGHVTLARACWVLRAGTFPAPRKGEGDAAYLPRLAGWLSGQGVPRRFYARVAGDGLVGLLGKTRKPMYVDVTDLALLTGFLRSLRDPAARLVLEEALPDPADAPRYADGERRVTEYVVQLSALPPGGPAR